MQFFRKKKLIYLILITLALISIFSIIYSFNIAITYGSTDFQYSPTVLFKEKINPYEYFLYSENTERIFPVQYPVYSHLTYFLFYIYALFDWPTAKILWGISNILIALISSIIITSHAQLKFKSILLILSLFFLSTPFRNCIGNGQLSNLILLIFCSFLITSPNLKNFFLGFSYIKYSFMPLCAFIILKKDGLKGFIISFLVCSIGWILFSIYLNQNILDTLFQPIYSGFKGYDNTLARGDIYTIINFFYASDNFPYLIISLLFLISFLIAQEIAKEKDLLLSLSLMSVANLFIFGHLIYDYVLLLPLLVYSFKNFSNKISKLSLIIIFYFWFGIRLVEYVRMYLYNLDVIVPTKFDVILNFLLLLILYFINSKNSVQNLKFNKK